MALEAGTRFGTYEIVGPLGVGGMGEVYRARDTTLEREVAIKVLPESFAEDADRVARFEREAKTLASLNHSNIAQIYGLEKSGGATAIVMELVEGPTLAERIEQGPMPADEAMNIAMQIVAALEAAHGAMVVHRDLKPANIKLKPDGSVKVLDFGIAKAVDFAPTSGSAPQMTTPAMTQTGVILGTAAYMSPEQARGLPVDERTDIWAFGCLLYEMLTGQPAFGGEDVMLTLARVLANDTNVDSIPGTISPAVRHTIGLCLQKNMKKRIADIRDVRLALEGSFESATASETTIPVATRSLLQRAFAPAAALVAGLAIAAMTFWAFAPVSDQAVARFEVTPANLTIMSNSPSIALSPDGKSIAYSIGGSNSVGGDLNLRTLENLEARVLLANTTVASPFFSPDGMQIGFYENLAIRTLKRVSIQGGTPSTVATFTDPMRGASWGEDGTIVFASGAADTGLLRVSSLGGEPEILTTPAPDEGDHIWPEILPGGKTVLFTILGDTEENSRIAALTLDTGEITIIAPGGSYPRYAETGYLLYGRTGTIWAVPFDPGALATTGTPIPVVENVVTKGVDGATEFSLSRDGTLLYVKGDRTATESGLISIDPTGREQVVLAAAGLPFNVAASPDGSQVAISAIESGSNLDIWVIDIASGRRVALTRNSGSNRNPVFSPDGQSIVFGSRVDDRVELQRVAVDGSGGIETLAMFDEPITRVMPSSWSPDGSTLAFSVIGADGQVSMRVMTIDDEGSVVDLAPSGFNRQNPAISPDGRWFAYSSDETGTLEIYVERFPGGGRRQAVTLGGAVYPKWSRDGDAIYYLRTLAGGAPAGAGRTTVSGGTTDDEPLVLGATEELFDWNYYASPTSFGFFDLAGNDNRILTISQGAPGADSSSLQVILVQHWLEELERMMPR